MDAEVVARRHKLAMLQHQRVMEEAEFVAQLTRQAHNRAAATPVRPNTAAAVGDARKRIDVHLVG